MTVTVRVSLLGLTAAGLAAVASLSSCAAPAPLPPPPAPAKAAAPIEEEPLAPVGTVDMKIIDFSGVPSADRQTVSVNGTIINEGTRATREVTVHVEALDRNGAVVASTDTVPSTQSILPGSSATFSATFDNRPDIDTYHAEAVGR